MTYQAFPNRKTLSLELHLTNLQILMLTCFDRSLTQYVTNFTKCCKLSLCLLNVTYMLKIEIIFFFCLILIMFVLIVWHKNFFHIEDCKNHQKLLYFAKNCTFYITIMSVCCLPTLLQSVPAAVKCYLVVPASRSEVVLLH